MGEVCTQINEVIIITIIVFLFLKSWLGELLINILKFTIVLIKYCIKKAAINEK